MKPIFIYTSILALILFIAIPTLVFSQGYDYIEDEGTSLWEEEGFIDSSGAESEFGADDGQYIGEEEVEAREEALKQAQVPGLDIAAALEKDKKLLPDNILYGVGTGVVIGGWFALLQGKNARENVQYVSLGILAGVLLGITVGTKSLYTQTAYHFNDEFQQRFEPPQPALPAGNNKMLARIDFEYRF